LPYPGTKLYEMAKESGFEPPKKTEDWDEVNNYFTKKDSSYQKPWVRWKESFETANIRKYIFMLKYLDIYRTPVFLKRLVKWRMKNSFYFFPVDVIILTEIWRVLRYQSSRSGFLRFFKRVIQKHFKRK
jgi:hypothetical protein